MAGNSDVGGEYAIGRRRPRREFNRIGAVLLDVVSWEQLDLVSLWMAPVSSSPSSSKGQASSADWLWDIKVVWARQRRNITMPGMRAQKSRKVIMKEKAPVRKRTLHTKNGQNWAIRWQVKPNFGMLLAWLVLDTIGEMFRSQRVLRIERSENMIDAIGREGRQATRPKESPTQDEVSGRSQGS